MNIFSDRNPFAEPLDDIGLAYLEIHKQTLEDAKPKAAAVVEAPEKKVELLDEVRVPDINHPVYQTREKPKGWTSAIKPGTLDYHAGGRTLRKRLPQFTKSDHLEAGDEHIRQQKAHAEEYGRISREAYADLSVKKIEPGPLISGILSDKFNDDTKEQLRHHAIKKGEHTDAAFAHYAAARLHIDTARKRFQALKEETITEANTKNQAKAKFTKHNDAALFAMNDKQKAAAQGKGLETIIKLGHLARRHTQAADAAAKIAKEETQTEATSYRKNPATGRWGHVHSKDDPYLVMDKNNKVIGQHWNAKKAQKIMDTKGGTSYILKSANDKLNKEETINEIEMNPIEAYAEAGKKAARARREGDENRAKFHSDWAKKAIALEKGDHQKNAKETFERSYREAGTPPERRFK